MKHTKLILLLILIILPNVYSHPGNTASDGCHYCRTNCDKWGVPWNERHCHNKPATEETTETPRETASNSLEPKPTYFPPSKTKIEETLIPKEKCKGCNVDNKCLQYGSRLIKNEKTVYCNFNTELIIQKQNNEQCLNNYECVNNNCWSGKCQDINERIQSIEKELKEQRTLLQKILDYFSKIFS